MNKQEFIRNFVGNDMHFEDFNAEQLSFFRQELIDLGFLTHAEELTEEKFNEISVTINHLFIEMEETEMNENNKNVVEAAVEEMLNKFAAAKENIKVQAGDTRDEFIDKVDDSVEVMKGALGKTLGVLDGALGYSVLKDAILDVLEAGSTETSRKDLFKMAKRCRELIELEIENLEFWGDEESLKKAVQLKALTEDERGKSIFESFACGIIWICKKVVRKLRSWYDSIDEKSIFKSVLRGIGAFANVLRAGVKIVWNATKFAVSFVIAGAIKLGEFIVRCVRSVVEKIKNWNETRKTKATQDTKEEDAEVEAEVVAEAEAALA